MKHKIIILMLSIITCSSFTYSQEILPCISESFDTAKEMHEIGVGKGETPFAATLNAVSIALNTMKNRIEQTYSNYSFIYEISSQSSAEGEQIAIETTLGQPNIVCNEVIMFEPNRFIVYLVLSIDMQELRETN